MLTEIIINKWALLGMCESEFKSVGLLSPTAASAFGADLVRPRDRSSGNQGMGESGSDVVG